MPKLNEQGIVAQALILLVLAAGIAGGVYLVQHPQIFQPKASEIAPDYAVGVSYHATSSDFINSTFMSKYHEGNIRTTVRSQLQSMADSGAKVIRTGLWIVNDPSIFVDENWRLSFPPTSQEISNIRQYTQDVASIQASDGHHLSLYLSFGWLGCADYQRGSVTTTVGYCNLTWSQFLQRVNQTYTGVINAVSDVNRGDGQKVVDVIHYDGEVMMGAKPNEERFFTDLYPDFVSKANAAGITPSLTFNVHAHENALDNNYTDGDYPALNGHRSLYWVYRTTEFMRQNNLPLPDRMDLSFYPAQVNNSYEPLVRRVMDDMEALYPGKNVVIAETYYLPDKVKRDGLGAALVSEHLRSGQPITTLFWTTPDGGGPGVNNGFPFDIGSYLPVPPPPPSGDISASPNPCSITSGALCRSTITWNSTNGSNEVGVWVKDTGSDQPGRYTLFAHSPSGSGEAPWIQVSPHSYVFELRGNAPRNSTASVTNNPPGVLLDSVTVTANGVVVTPSPTPRPTTTPTASSTATTTPTPTPTASPTATPAPLVGDINGDGVVNNADLSLLVAAFGDTGANLAADLNHNNKVDIFDYNLLIQNYD